MGPPDKRECNQMRGGTEKNNMCTLVSLLHLQVSLINEDNAPDSKHAPAQDET